MIQKIVGQLKGRFSMLKPQILIGLAIIAGCVVVGLDQIVLRFDDHPMGSIAFLAIIIGWSLYRSRISTVSATLLNVLSGIITVILGVGRLARPLLSQIMDIASYLWSYVVTFVNNPRDTQAISFPSGFTEFWLDLSVIFDRFWLWMASVLDGQSNFDPIGRGIFWGTAVWFMLIWVCWGIVRARKPLLGLLPIMILLTLGLDYTGGRAAVILYLSFALLILLVLTHYDFQERRWESENIDYSDEIRIDIQWVGLALSGSLLILALLTPSISIRQIVNDIRERFQESSQSDTVTDSFGLRAEPAPQENNPFEEIHNPRLPTVHLVGSGPELSDEVVFRVQILAVEDQYDPDQNLDRGFYWRAITFDRYTGFGWTSSRYVAHSYDAGESFVDFDTENAYLIRGSIQVSEDEQELVYAPGELVTLDRDFVAALRPVGDPAAVQDIYAALISHDSYWFDTVQFLYSENELREASHEYPEWIKTRYLALPESISPQVRDLALEITASEPTQFDRAVAIERYLRGFDYTLDIPQPPHGREISDYFLFDLKRGYCDYYATTMVVLSRAAGIPARLAVGYAAGTYDPTNDEYVITADMAHAWVEVYFPKHGWVVFEPTAGRPALERAVDREIAPMRSDTLLSEPITKLRVRRLIRTGIFWGTGLLAAACIGLITWVLSDSWRLKRMTTRSFWIELFRRFQRYGPWLGIAVRPEMTAHEYCREITDLLQMASDRTGEFHHMSDLVVQLKRFTDSFGRKRYGLDDADAESHQLTLKRWRTLRVRLIVMGLLIRFRRWRARFDQDIHIGGDRDLSRSYPLRLRNL